MDALDKISEAIELYRKEVKNLTQTKNFLKDSNTDLQNLKDSLDRDIEARKKKLSDLDGIINVQQADKLKAIDNESVNVQKLRTQLTEDQANFEKQVGAFERGRRALIAENDALKADKDKVEALRKDLEAKLAKHKEAVETLR